MTSGPSLATHPRASFANVVGRLTGVNAAMLAAGLVTGTVTARVLGVEGRGELAAIMAVLTMAPWLLEIGLSQWLARERALGRRREELLGVALPLAVGCSLVGVVAAIPLSHVLGDGRSAVVTYLQIGMFLLPLTVVLQMLLGLAIGESRWGLYSATRLATNVLPALVIVVLALIGQLTVASAAATYIGCTLVGNLLLLATVRGVRRLKFDGRRARLAAAFGGKTWISSIGGAANYRLDQILMAGLVPSRELGLYAVAVTVTSVTYGLIVAVSSAMYPRVVGGDSALAAGACRITVLVVATSSLLLGVAAPAMIPFVFGSEFREALSMVLILLFASVPMAAAIVLTAALGAANDPGAAMRAELAALAVGVPALILLLPESGGNGAAVASVVAYTVRLALLLRSAGRRFGMRWSRFLLPAREDLIWLGAQLRGLSRRTSDGRVAG